MYESLHRLQKLGLISFRVRNNIRYYSAESLERFFQQLDGEKTELLQQFEKLRDTKTHGRERNESDTFEGVYGFRRAFEKHVELYEPNEEVLIMSFSPRLYNLSVLRKFFRSLDPSLLEKGVRVRMILDRRTKNTFGRDKTKLKNYQIRYMSPGYFNPSAINISKRQVLLSVWSEHPIVFAINNPQVIESFRQNFEFLWKTTK